MWVQGCSSSGTFIPYQEMWGKNVTFVKLFHGSSFGYEYVPFLFAITSCSVPCSAYPHLLLTARSAAQYNISVWLKVFPSYRFTFHEAPLNRLINYTQASFCNWHPSFRNRALFPSTIFQQFFLMYV